MNLPEFEQRSAEFAALLAEYGAACQTSGTAAAQSLANRLAVMFQAECFGRLLGGQTMKVIRNES